MSQHRFNSALGRDLFALGVSIAAAKSKRESAGAVATFHHFRSHGMSAKEAHQVIRKWCYDLRPSYAPNPLCMTTRRSMTEFYDRPGHNTGD